MAELTRGPLLTAFQSRHAACNISTNASLSGLFDPSETTLRGSTTGESQPSDVKCGVYENADDAEEEEDAAAEEVVEEGVEDEEEEEVGEDGAELPFVANRAARVRSAWGMKVWLPVRSARR